mmetsp:Transcript_31938/g.42167  ORF Transcript_31938/g.42167 Transcript_31938/m.42167 type:complete len:124 (+) Transcript_31938:35-406(+)
MMASKLFGSSAIVNVLSDGLLRRSCAAKHVNLGVLEKIQTIFRATITKNNPFLLPNNIQARGYKLKPRKAVTKRFSLTSTGKIKRRKAHHSHNTGKKSPAEITRLSAGATCTGKIAKNIKKMM